MRTLVVLVVMVSTASAQPSHLLTLKEFRAGSAIGLDGSWYSSLAVCDGKLRRGILTSGCTVGMFGRTASGAWQGDGMAELATSYEVVPNLHLRSAIGVSIPLLIEGIARGIRAIKHVNDDEAEAAAAEAEAERHPFPWYAVHVSSSASVRYQRPSSSYFVELEVSYHLREGGSTADWQQPEGTYVGFTLGLAREWIARRQ